MIQETSVMVYQGYFYLIMNYGNIFWEYSPYRLNIFWLKKNQLELLHLIGIENPVETCLKH
jgi:hypothetical protein